jgi:hypothetical protein
MLEKMGSDPGSVMTADVIAKIERLFGVVNERFRKSAERAKEPFQ